MTDMNKSLSGNIGFWLLIIASVAMTAVGGWILSVQIPQMTTALIDGTANSVVDVYVGQSLVVVAAGVLAAGIVGILFALGLVAARSMFAASAPAVVEAIDWTSEADAEPLATITDQAATDDTSAVSVNEAPEESAAHR